MKRGELSPDAIDAIARVCHEANTAYCIGAGDPVLPHWHELTEDYRESSRAGVRQALAGATHAELHASWMAERTAQGWVYGPILDREAKIHPCLVPYPELPETQKRKDALFSAIVLALADPF